MPFAMAGAGPAIIFIVSMAGWAIVSVNLIILASRVYLVIVQATAAGIDRVEWPDEPVFDWVVPALSFAGLVGVILLPAGLLSRALATVFLPDDRPARHLALAVPFLWLFFPLGVLTLLASSPRGAGRGATIGGLLRRAPSVAVFYVVTAGLLAAGGALGYLAVFGAAWYTLPVAAVALAAVHMVHARLVGRLGYLAHEQRPRPARGVLKKKTGTRPRRLAATDPWADPEPGDPPPAKANGLGYALVEESASPRPPRPRHLDPEPEPYLMADAADPPPVAAPAVGADPHASARVEREIAMRRRDPPNPPPASPLWSGVYSFPFYPTSRRPLFWLGFWALLDGVFVRTMVAFYPH